MLLKLQTLNETQVKVTVRISQSETAIARKNNVALCLNEVVVGGVLTEPEQRLGP